MSEIPTPKEAREARNEAESYAEGEMYKSLIKQISSFLSMNPNGGMIRPTLLMYSVIDKVMPSVIAQLYVKGWFVSYKKQWAGVTILIRSQPIDTWWKRFKLDWRY